MLKSDEMRAYPNFRQILNLAWDVPALRAHSVPMRVRGSSPVDRCIVSVSAVSRNVI